MGLVRFELRLLRPPLAGVGGVFLSRLSKPSSPLLSSPEGLPTGQVGLPLGFGWVSVGLYMGFGLLFGSFWVQYGQRMGLFTVTLALKKVLKIQFNVHLAG